MVSRCLSSLSIQGAQHNVVFAVSEHDSVYAFDVDTEHQPGKRNPGTERKPQQRSWVLPDLARNRHHFYSGHRSNRGAEWNNLCGGHVAGPVGRLHQRLHALDVTTGTELAGSPAEIHASYPGAGANSTSGMVGFDPGRCGACRPAVLEPDHLSWLDFALRSTVHRVADGLQRRHSESRPRFESHSERPRRLDLDGRSGPGCRSSGNIYFLDANGTFETTLDTNGLPVLSDYGNGFLKISSAGNTLTVADYFQPFDTVTQSRNDQDLGSGGVIVCQTNRMLQARLDTSGRAGKNRTIYLADRDSMGKFNPSGNSLSTRRSMGPLPVCFRNPRTSIKPCITARWAMR